ncbi:peptide-N4-(N-acetyl-beta-glucosaminyl)asparagine amidase A-like [Salvia hispanica]|uniref:peptide-N4-(N-acetyl-beta- glucosaminyl)asparagine amidase A-like n=1 Tax=Salvia hispanica TaxID=49212 RepID=UPI002009B488|nr:peptide-N4-(N-acetyl-beta-glucosaminyl)asparagine amidase A-like [Salvia hispanica]
MAATIPSLLLTLILLHLHPPPLSAAANLRRTTTLFTPHFNFNSTLSSTGGDAPPTTYFEVTKPIQLPATAPCSYLLLQHDFAFTYGQPPVLAAYTPPPHCPSPTSAKIVLEWTATCKGRQFDRIFGIWIGGAEILRSCTAEPSAAGIIWTVKKDVTRYSSLLSTNQTLAVYLGNLVDSTYTGVYHVNISLHFYATEEKTASTAADLILPISKNPQSNDGLWFEIENSKQAESKQFRIPLNTYRAVLEIYVSFHENDEFWYGNPPNEYLSANNLTDLAGNGPFREIVVKLDGEIVGAVFPFTVIYTGGVNPLLWRPISAIGSFDLPTYDVDLTPFLGELLDNKPHDLEFSVTNALNVWYIDANLHLWLDEKSEKTQGKILEHRASELSLSVFSNFTGLDGVFVTNASRSIVSSGVVSSSRGEVVTTSLRELGYTSSMTMGNDGNRQVVEQVITFNTSVDSDHRLASSPSSSANAERRFSIWYATDYVDNDDGSYASVANVTLGFEEGVRRSGVGTSRVRNVQRAEGSTVVRGNLVVSGVGRNQQEYGYSSDKWCYFRNVSSFNYTILHDEVSHACIKDRLWPYSSRRNFRVKKGLIGF